MSEVPLSIESTISGSFITPLQSTFGEPVPLRKDTKLINSGPACIVSVFTPVNTMTTQSVITITAYW